MIVLYIALSLVDLSSQLTHASKQSDVCQVKGARRSAVVVVIEGTLVNGLTAVL